ncbi:O-antigen ligase family protein [Acinetobacter radioresistens]|uniref:O-antigen ligase family protein n=1 Tax=Acinetobacter radioresistens TaxID=40216 RepID=UPI00224835EA|nr:O-antigen ligase family protein [Acinetobacter radioresistens]MCX0339646.1 O-antigen ligase family protein [Acinetobacter radioresistens]
MNINLIIGFLFFLIVSTLYSLVNIIFFPCIVFIFILFLLFKNSKNIDTPSLLYIIFSFWVLGSLTWSVNYLNSLVGTIFLFLLYLGIVFLYLSFKSNIFLLSQTIYLIILASLILNFRNLYLYIFISNDGPRFSGIAEQPNSLGLLSSTFCVTIIIYNYLFGQYNSKYKNYVCYIALLFSIFFLFLSGSRGSLLSVLVPSIYILINFKRILRIKYILLFSSVVFLFFIFYNKISNLIFFQRILLLPQALGFNIGNPVEVSEDLEAAGDDSRLNIAQIVLENFYNNPILGYGISSFKYFSNFVYTHNTFLEIMFSLGLVGLILYYFPLLFIFFKSFSFNKDNRISKSIRGLFIFILLSGMAIPSFQSKTQVITLFLYLSLYGILLNLKKR